MLTVEGVYDGGKIKIPEGIPFKERRNVLITFLDQSLCEKDPETETFRTSAQVLLDLFGSWEDDREAGEIVSEIKNASKTERRILMYLLDTDTVIYSMKGAGAVKENLMRHYNDPITISIVTLMELCYGAYKSQRTAANLSKIKTLEQSLEIVPFDMKSAERFGMVKAQPETKGTRLDDSDLMIAACALTRNLTLVTNNMKHFGRIEGLKFTNWSE